MTFKQTGCLVERISFIESGIDCAVTDGNQTPWCTFSHERPRFTIRWVDNASINLPNSYIYHTANVHYFWERFVAIKKLPTEEATGGGRNPTRDICIRKRRSAMNESNFGYSNLYFFFRQTMRKQFAWLMWSFVDCPSSLDQMSRILNVFHLFGILTICTTLSTDHLCWKLNRISLVWLMW